ncbi:MAG: HAD family hydrolase [Candidatus Omnitrophica bacterium]|jgi:phosphoglycolate phosphatase|nr:HAD family hydrolase [Candidatus Omnitrophota bacterium]MDD5252527.1 HAD family hydrolase [Candidatus Omnitrophota bacterium]
MQNIKLIIFDLDGTLIDAYAAICSSYNYVMRKLGLKPKSPAVIRRLVGWGDMNLLKPYVPERDLKRSLRLYRDHHKLSLLRQSRLYPYARTLLRKLKARGLKLAVASNRPSKFSLILLKHLRIMNYFDYVLCADKLKRGKPDPEILNKIIKRFALKKSQVLYVGDMVIDAEAGRRAKVKTIIVTSGSSSIAEIKKERPFKIISGVRGLLKIT